MTLPRPLVRCTALHVLLATTSLVFVATGAEGQARYDEPHRPQFHFSPEKNWMNDPNGCVFFDGEWHLFYQYNPEGDTWGHMSWGHAVSTDLVRWKHLPVALREEAGVMIFSGSAVVDHNNTSDFGKDGKPPLVAIYTGHGHGKQTQNIAYSTDRGRTWTKYENNPVIDINSNEFRDPKVIWHAPSKRWVMVVARPDVKKVLFYGSRDLKQWEQLGEFGGQGAVDGIWECPDLFELPVYRGWRKTDESHWVLVVNINGGTPAGGSGCQYFVGRFDGKTFVNDNPKETVRWADYGADFYAAQSWSDVPEQDGRRIWIAWMSNWRYANQEPTKPWRTAMTVPRELGLVKTPAGLRLRQQPVRELASSRPRWGKSWEGKADGEVPLELGMSHTQPWVSPTFRPTGAREVGLRLKFDAREPQEVRIGYDAVRKEVFVDRTRAGGTFHKEFPARHAAPMNQRPDGAVHLEVLIDRSSVEVFSEDGVTVITDRIFPGGKLSGISAYAEGGPLDATVNLTGLQSIWPEVQ